MKRFTISVLTVAVFFLGLGALVEKTGARFKSDERALDLVRKARVAIGGDAAINAIESMTIVGRTTNKIKVNGTDTTMEGETEIALQLPDKMSRMVKIGKDDGTGRAHTITNKQVDVVVVGDAKDKMKVTVNGDGNGGNVSKRLVVKKDDGTVLELTGADADKWIAEHPGVPGKKEIVLERTGGSGGTATFTSKDGKTFDVEGHKVVMTGHGDMEAHHNAMKSNELLRTTLSLLLTAPKGLDVDYTFGGTGDIDGRNCNIVIASFGGQSFKLFLDTSSNLPVALGYKGMSMPRVVKFDKEVPAPVDGAKDVVFFKREAGPADMTDVLIKFSDYRAVNGVQLPFKWTQTDETFDVTSYEINPANIGEKFQNQKVMVRMAKPDSK